MVTGGEGLKSGLTSGFTTTTMALCMMRQECATSWPRNPLRRWTWLSPLKFLALSKIKKKCKVDDKNAFWEKALKSKQWNKPQTKSKHVGVGVKIWMKKMWLLNICVNDRTAGTSSNMSLIPNLIFPVMNSPLTWAHAGTQSPAVTEIGNWSSSPYWTWT
jgi:hypothetical protein